MKGLGALLLIDVVIPVATYYLFRAFDQSQTVALLAATIASALRNIQVIVKHREVDGFAAFMFVILSGCSRRGLMSSASRV